MRMSFVFLSSLLISTFSLKTVEAQTRFASGAFFTVAKCELESRFSPDTTREIFINVSMELDRFGYAYEMNQHPQVVFRGDDFWEVSENRWEARYDGTKGYRLLFTKDGLIRNLRIDWESGEGAFHTEEWFNEEFHNPQNVNDISLINCVLTDHNLFDDFVSTNQVEKTKHWALLGYEVSGGESDVNSFGFQVGDESRFGIGSERGSIALNRRELELGTGAGEGSDYLRGSLDMWRLRHFPTFGLKNLGIKLGGRLNSGDEQIGEIAAHIGPALQFFEGATRAAFVIEIQGYREDMVNEYSTYGNAASGVVLEQDLGSRIQLEGNYFWDDDEEDGFNDSWRQLKLGARVQVLQDKRIQIKDFDYTIKGLEFNARYLHSENEYQDAVNRGLVDPSTRKLVLEFRWTR